MPHKGTFVLADISGFSQYLDEAGLQHASDVTAELLNALIEANGNRWQIANLEGDCVFFFREGREPTSELLAHLRSLFERFSSRRLEIGRDSDCGCGACKGANELALKFIVHAGEYAEQRIGGRREIIGPDVVTAHRLLKNDTGLSEYVILTRSYLGHETLSEYQASESSLKTAGGSVAVVILDIPTARQ